MTGFKPPPKPRQRSKKNDRRILDPRGQSVIAAPNPLNNCVCDLESDNEEGKCHCQPYYNDLNGCICDLLELPEANIKEGDMELCSRHELMGLPRKRAAVPAPSTFVVDLEQDSSKEERPLSQSERERLDLERQKEVVRRLENKEKKWKAKRDRNYRDMPRNGLDVQAVRGANQVERQKLKYVIHRQRLFKACMKLAKSEKKWEESQDKEEVRQSGQGRGGADSKTSRDHQPAGPRASEFGAPNVGEEERKNRQKMEKERIAVATQELRISEPGRAGPSSQHTPTVPATAPSTRGSYNHRTLASDVLRAAGIHPYLPPLNAHMRR